MKRVLILTCLLFCFYCSSGQGFSGQIIAGINASQIEGDLYTGYYKAGLVAGMSANFPFTDHWSFQPEVLYSQKGSSYKIDKQTYTLYDLKYIEFPIAFRYMMDNGIALEAGPSAAIYLSGTFTDPAGLEFDPGFAERSPADVLGFLGAEYVLTDGISFNVRLTYSIFVLPPSTWNPQPNRNNTLSFTLRLKLIRSKAEAEVVE